VARPVILVAVGTGEKLGPVGKGQEIGQREDPTPVGKERNTIVLVFLFPCEMLSVERRRRDVPASSRGAYNLNFPFPAFP
jgi:hypothetical protein